MGLCTSGSATISSALKPGRSLMHLSGVVRRLRAGFHLELLAHSESGQRQQEKRSEKQLAHGDASVTGRSGE